MNKHRATVKILESLDLGKRTGQESGLEIEIYDTNTEKLGTIYMGQGTVAWYTKNAKKETEKSGKLPPTISFKWSEFAAFLDKLNAVGKKRAMKMLLKADKDIG